MCSAQICPCRIPWGQESRADPEILHTSSESPRPHQLEEHPRKEQLPSSARQGRCSRGSFRSQAVGGGRHVPRYLPCGARKHWGVPITPSMSHLCQPAPPRLTNTELAAPTRRLSVCTPGTLWARCGERAGCWGRWGVKPGNLLTRPSAGCQEVKAGSVLQGVSLGLSLSTLSPTTCRKGYIQCCIL